MYDLYVDDHDKVRLVQWVQKGSKKTKQNILAPVYKYNIEVLMNAGYAKKIYEDNKFLFLEGCYE